MESELNGTQWAGLKMNGRGLTRGTMSVDSWYRTIASSRRREAVFLCRPGCMTGLGPIMEQVNFQSPRAVYLSQNAR